MGLLINNVSNRTHDAADQVGSAIGAAVAAPLDALSDIQATQAGWFARLDDLLRTIQRPFSVIGAGLGAAAGVAGVAYFVGTMAVGYYLYQAGIVGWLVDIPRMIITLVSGGTSGLIGAVL